MIRTAATGFLLLACALASGCATIIFLVILPGVVGFAVDGATGAMFEYEPGYYMATLRPDPGADPVAGIRDGSQGGDKHAPVDAAASVAPPDRE
jgi:hypothetical protein